jgi:hypothetical protein
MLREQIQGEAMVLLTDIHAHLFYDRRDGAEMPTGR